MSDLTEETYFNKEYLGATLWYGLAVINALANLGWFMYLPTYVKYGKLSEIDWLNKWTKMAWGWMIGGNYWWYWFIGAVWLFSYIRKPFPQKALFFSIIVGQAIAWVATLWINICWIVGGAMDEANWGNLYYPLIYDFFFFGLNALDYYLLFPKYAAYYRWREQDWWKEKWDGWLEAGGMNLDLDDKESEEGMFNEM